jgi:phytoene desaturase
VRVVVVGAGLGGLAAACHLVGRGHEVVVLEREDVPGGRAGLLEAGGFRLDTGPSILTMREILGATFAAAGADMGEHLRLKPVDPMYRACFADGSEIRVWHGREAMAAEIREGCGPAEAAAFGRFCDFLADLYRLELPHFIDRNFDSPLDLAFPPGPLARLVRLGGLRKLDSVVNSYFADPRLQRLFSFQSMYAGLSPMDAFAIYCVITYMDTVEGVFFPEGGMHAVPRALAAAAEKAGTEFRYGAVVERVERSPSGRATGVRLLGGEVVAADAVVLNPDLPVAYRRLLPGVALPRVAAKGRYSPSCAVWLAGVRGGGLPEGAAHHNIHFGAAWEGAFDALMKAGVLMRDPSILVSTPTASDPSLAPPGGTALYVLEPTPNLDGRVDWDAERDGFKQRLLARVAALGYPTGDVVVERFTDPTHWEAQGMERGTPFGLAHTFFQTGPFRPNNVDKRVPGVVFVGSSTVPGVGVPMVLLSGGLAAARVDQLAEP